MLLGLARMVFVSILRLRGFSFEVQGVGVQEHHALHGSRPHGPQMVQVSQ